MGTYDESNIFPISMAPPSMYLCIYSIQFVTNVIFYGLHLKKVIPHQMFLALLVRWMETHTEANKKSQAFC